MSKTEKEKTKVDIDLYRDSCKLFFDFYKHSTTISIGAIVLLVSVFTKLEGAIKEREFLLNAIIMFIVAIAGSMIVMFIYAAHIQGRKEIQNTCRNIIAVASMFVGCGLLGGLVALYLFAKSNI